jgi:hypothetical protein
MLDTFYWLAAGLAIAGLRRGNWTALPLLGSVAFCLIVRAAELPFSEPLWIAVDLAVIAGVGWPLLPIIRARAWMWLRAFWRELAIVALFVPGFYAYTLTEEPAHIVSSLVATAQLLVTVPYACLYRQWVRALHRYQDWCRFDLRVSAR